MPVIHELSPHLADLIAAGEVVERPASVAKELIENAIDAGASRVTVEIENGGVSYLRIADDGCGMNGEDAPTAFRRHATSKLRTEADLAAIGTLGFRGEALAAIAAVSRIDLFTRQDGAISGWHLHLEAGQITQNEEAGCPKGTTIVVRDLFFNTPARMKFLKKDFTEAGYILGVVQHAALSHPEIAFTLIRDGKQVFSVDGKGKLLTPVFQVFGKELTESMLPIPKTERGGLTVHGYIIKPHAGRANRAMQHFFVNGRYVKSRTMQAALEEAYRNAIITGKYPSGAVFLEVPLNAVDVNVHPAKTEIKFSQEKPVFDAVYAACKNALAAGDNIPLLRPKERAAAPQEDHITREQQRFATTRGDAPVSAAKPQEAPKLEDFLVHVPPRETAHRPYQNQVAAPPIMQKPSKAVLASAAIAPSAPPKTQEVTQADAPKAEVKLAPRPSAQATPEQPQATPMQELTPLDGGARVLGECFRTYLIAEDKQGLILIDKHAAHERLLFNKLCAQSEIPSQALLSPVVVELTAEQAAGLTGQLDLLEQAGFAVSPFGGNSFAVRAVPAYLDSGDIPSVLSELADKALDNRTVVPDRLDDLIHTVACKAAIRAGKATSMLELQDLCDRVLRDENVRSCPHGRPVTVRLTKYELDKLFKRVNQ